MKSKLVIFLFALPMPKCIGTFGHKSNVNHRLRRSSEPLSYGAHDVRRMIANERMYGWIRMD